MLLDHVLFHDDYDPDSYPKICCYSVSIQWVVLGTLKCVPLKVSNLNPPGATSCRSD
jgi:hypothetical protein